MKIIILDSEYICISKKNSNLKNLIKFKKKMFPEIFQISFLKSSNIYSKKKQKKLNIFIKIRQKLPKRIAKLTNTTSSLLQRKGFSFKKSLDLIDKFIDKKSIFIDNGGDLELLKHNIKFHNIKRHNKKIINYVNLSKMTKIFNKNKIIGTENLNKIFKFKINYNKHNSLNDCITINRSLKIIIKNYGKKEFKKLILANKKLISF
jgi:hypothetical protein